MNDTGYFDGVYILASFLSVHEDVDNVEAREGRITIAHVPEDRHTDEIPLDLFDYINDTIEGTVYQWELDEEPSPSLVEKHSVVGGSHSRAIAGGNPELQVHLVK